MTTEKDKNIYIGICNVLAKPHGCEKEFRIVYQIVQKEIEDKYGKETTRSWIEEC